MNMLISIAKAAFCSKRMILLALIIGVYLVIRLLCRIVQKLNSKRSF